MNEFLESFTVDYQEKVNRKLEKYKDFEDYMTYEDEDEVSDEDLQEIQ